MKKEKLYPFYALVLMLWMAACKTAGVQRFSPARTFSAASVQQDLRSMELILKKNHPSLYWYTDSLTLQNAFARARYTIRDSMTEPEIRNLMNEVLSVIRCGHTSVQHSGIYGRYISWKAPSGFPLTIKIADDTTLVVAANFNRADSLLTRGTSVLAVNGLKAKQLIDTLFPLIPGDGYSRTFSHQLISNNFSRFYNSRFPKDSSYRIQYSDSTGNIHTILRSFYNPHADTALRSVSFRKVKKVTPPNKILRQEQVRSFWVDSTGEYAILKMNTFSHQIKRKYIRQQFRYLHTHQIPNLIIDLRNNGGGLIAHSLLLARMIHHQPFVYIDSIVTPVKKLMIPEGASVRIRKKLWINIAMRWLNRKQPDGLRRFSLFAGKTYHPHKDQYKGNVYVLTGGLSFSATSMFLASVKGLSHVTVVGEESGGGAYGNNGIFIPDVILKHTGLRMRLPVYRIVNNHKLENNGRGVMPDVEVKAASESIRLNKDVKMIRAEKMIREKKNLQSFSN